MEELEVYIFLAEDIPDKLGLRMGNESVLLTPEQARYLAAGFLEALKELEGATRTLH
jgi:hypothetical protein